MDPSSPNEEPQNKFSQQDLLNQVKSWWKTVACVLAVVLTFAFLTGPSKAQKKEVENCLSMVKFRFDSVCDQEFVKSAGLVGSRVKPVDGEKVLLSPKGIPFRTPAFKEIGQLFIIGLLVYDKDLYEWENLPKPFAKKYNSFVKDVNIFRKEQESYTGEKLKSRMHSLYSQWCELCRFAEKKYGIETAPYSGIGINGKILSTISSSVGLL